MSTLNNVLVNNNIVINLKDDYILYIKNNLDREGIVYNDNDKYLIYKYFNLHRRLIPEGRKNIVKSKEFACPENYLNALKEIEDKIIQGRNLIPHLSDTILNFDFSDKLLNDWNIHHLHLSKRFRDDGFAKRSDYELFIYFTNNMAYFIQIYPHNKSNLYSTQEMVKIIDRNWPQLIARHQIKDVISLERYVDDASYEQLRNSNVSSFVQTDNNKVFVPIGGGYMSNGFSFIALRNADDLVDRLKKYENYIISTIQYIIHTPITDYIKSNNMNLRLLWFDSIHKITVFDEINGAILQFDFINNNIRICKPNEIFEEEPHWQDCLTKKYGKLESIIN